MNQNRRTLRRFLISFSCRVDSKIYIFWIMENIFKKEEKRKRDNKKKTERGRVRKKSMRLA